MSPKTTPAKKSTVNKGKPAPAAKAPVKAKAEPKTNDVEGYGNRQGTSRAAVIDVICAAAGLPLQCGTTLKGRTATLSRDSVIAAALQQDAFQGKKSKPEWYLGNALKFIKAETNKTVELIKPAKVAAPKPKAVAKGKPAAVKAKVPAKAAAKGKPGPAARAPRPSPLD